MGGHGEAGSPLRIVVSFEWRSTALGVELPALAESGSPLGQVVIAHDANAVESSEAVSFPRMKEGEVADVERQGRGPVPQNMVWQVAGDPLDGPSRRDGLIRY